MAALDVEDPDEVSEAARNRIEARNHLLVFQAGHPDGRVTRARPRFEPGESELAVLVVELRGQV